MNSSILADIEETLSDETTIDINCKYWYWNEFLPKIDEDNIRNDYRLVYQSFTKAECVYYLPYDITDERWDWLIKNQIVVIDHFDYEGTSQTAPSIAAPAKPISFSQTKLSGVTPPKAMILSYLLSPSRKSDSLKAL